LALFTPHILSMLFLQIRLTVLQIVTETDRVNLSLSLRYNGCDVYGTFQVNYVSVHVQSDTLLLIMT